MASENLRLTKKNDVISVALRMEERKNELRLSGEGKTVLRRGRGGRGKRRVGGGDRRGRRGCCAQLGC